MTSQNDRERGSGVSNLKNPYKILLILWLLLTISSVAPILGECDDYIKSNWSNVIPLILEVSVGSMTAFISLNPGPVSIRIMFTFLLAYSSSSIHSPESCCDDRLQIMVGVQHVILIILLWVLFCYRSHTHGSINELGIEMLALPVCLSGAVVTIIPKEEACYFMIPFFSGFFVTLSIFTFLAICVEIWYPVGSNQVRMVALDGLGMVYFFFFPLFLIVSLALSNVNLAEQLRNLSFLPEETFHSLPYVSFITMAIAPTIIHSISPIALHFFVNVYTHGKPNTKKVAVVCSLSQLISSGKYDSSSLKQDEDFQRLAKILNAKKFSLNILLSSKDLRENKEVLKTFPFAASFSSNLNDVALYKSTFDCFPSWAIPSTLAECRDAFQLNSKLKLILWSTKTLHVPFILEDVQKSNGGNIIMLNGANDKKGQQNTIDVIMQLIDKGLIMEQLDEVLGKDIPMILS